MWTVSLLEVSTMWYLISVITKENIEDMRTPLLFNSHAQRYPDTGRAWMPVLGLGISLTLVLRGSNLRHVALCGYGVVTYTTRLSVQSSTWNQWPRYKVLSPRGTTKGRLHSSKTLKERYKELKRFSGALKESLCSQYFKIYSQFLLLFFCQQYWKLSISIGSYINFILLLKD